MHSVQTGADYLKFWLALLGPCTNLPFVLSRHIHSENDLGQPARFFQENRGPIVSWENQSDFFFTAPIPSFVHKEERFPIFLVIEIEWLLSAVFDFKGFFKQLTLVRKLQTIASVIARIFGPEAKIIKPLGE